ncbi:helix-hairpin-helix domain-containing protein [candidate division WOR-3 bacterium]|nr:helix-hairpin-helix domain-containing protein [candidate division WOR-3 bacterium]
MILKTQSDLSSNKSIILGREARFDSSGCITKEGKHPFIYPSRGEGGGCTNLFKVLLTNICENNCLYCVNRKNRNKESYIFSPNELARTFMNYYAAGFVKGLFLSSGADPELINEAVPFSSRICINLEAPGDNYLVKLSKEKRFTRLLSILRRISDIRKKNIRARFSITSQFVVGAAGESDLCLLNLSKRLYKEFGLARVYYSGFSPQPDTPLDDKTHCPTYRIRRLYQADFLIRKYNFNPQEIIPSGNLSDTDPKLNWARSHPELFPVEINKSSFNELIRIPGIGLITAKRIFRAKQDNKFTSPEDMRKIGVRGKRHLDFITINSRYFGNTYYNL